MKSFARTEEISIPYQPPFDWPAALRFYAYHEVRGVDRVSEDAYERAFLLGGHQGYFHVRNDAKASRLLLRLSYDGSIELAEFVAQVRRMFDLDTDPQKVAATLERAPLLGDLARKYPGMRVVSGWDSFEAAICTVLGQLVSTAAARRLVAQLVEHYGTRLTHSALEESFAFPSPHKIANSDLSEVRTTGRRRATLAELARRVESGVISFVDSLSLEEMRSKLLAIQGIGPWSAEYICLRALGDKDAFPGTDLILKRAVELHPELDLDCVRPYRGYAAILLWREYAERLSRGAGKKN